MADKDNEKPQPGKLNPVPAEADEAMSPRKFVDKTPPARVDIDAVVDGWFEAHFPYSAIARHDECWQLLHRAVIDLKQRLKGEDHG
jgi:hypothetical protein